jgi:hypothetical protein
MGTAADPSGLLPHVDAAVAEDWSASHIAPRVAVLCCLHRMAGLGEARGLGGAEADANATHARKCWACGWAVSRGWTDGLGGLTRTDRRTGWSHADGQTDWANSQASGEARVDG